MKIVIIGCCGHTAQAHSEMMRNPEAEFVGIAPGSMLEVGKYNFERYGLPVFSDYETMLNETKPDVAIVSPIFGYTAKVIIDCANRGIDVFSEKPVATTMEDLFAVEEAVNRNKIRFSAMHFLRFSPNFYHAEKMVSEGAIGEVKLITAQKSYRFGTRPDWYWDREKYGGTIPWVGIHAIDWTYYFSKKKFVSVNALQVGSPEMYALCQYKMEDGVIASVNLDFLRPAAAPTHGDDRIRVAGTKGVIEVSGKKFVLINENGVQEFEPDTAPKLAYEFIIGNDLLTKEEIFMLTKAAILARESADSGKEIIIN